jgi:hypothetical protein
MNIMLVELVEHSLMITGFVFLMMLAVEYLNVLSGGRWQQTLKQNPLGSYLLSALLGSIPGCLGAYLVVSLYTHRLVSIGALVTVMIATSGDEAFVMFSLFPLNAAWLTLLLMAIGILAGYLTDLVFFRRDSFLKQIDHELEIHPEDISHYFSIKETWLQIKNLSFPRALLITMLILFILTIVLNIIGPKVWDWQKISFIIGASFAFFIIVTVPDHFLEEHLWNHVLKRHFLRILAWTFGALLVIHSLGEYWDVSNWIASNQISTLILACLVGLIPESGPHLLFVTLFDNGAIPFAILAASSIVQDGHAMLPLLAVSKKAFIWVKLINFAIGLFIGLCWVLFLN